jgi:predicted nucleotidyltransferase
MTKLQAEEQGLQGEVAKKQDELDDANDQLEENKKKYDINRSERLIRELSIRIQRAKQHPNFAKLPKESVETYIAATERLGEIVEKLNKHEEMLVTLNLLTEAPTAPSGLRGNVNSNV